MIYITGATGFIGSRVATRLLQRGEKIRCLVRSHAKAAWLADAGAELIEGDLTFVETHQRGVRGASAAIHLAAIYDIGIVDRDSLWRTNVRGTEAFIEALGGTSSPVRGEFRSVFVSSTVALGPGDGTAEPREAYDGPYHSIYHHTKAKSHRIAREAQRQGAPIIIVCPAFVYGPGDEGPAGRLLRDLKASALPALLTNPSAFSYAYVDDVADGIVAALERGKLGEVYVLGGENITLTEYVKRACAMMGVKPPRLRMPAALARVSTVALDAITRLTSIRFPVTHEAVVTTTGDSWVHEYARSRSDLGYLPRPVEEGLAATLRD